MSTIPEFNDTECWVVRTAVTERCGKRVEPRPTDREPRLDPDSPAVTVCAAEFWSERDPNFVSRKIGDSRYGSPLAYSLREHSLCD